MKNCWQCSSGKHTGKIDKGTLLYDALKLFRKKGGKGPLIIPSGSCVECGKEAKNQK